MKMLNLKSLVAAAAIAMAAVSSPAEAQTKKLVFIGAGSVPNVVYLPVYVAEKAGFFKGGEGSRSRRAMAAVVR